MILKFRLDLAGQVLCHSYQWSLMWLHLFGGTGWTQRGDWDGWGFSLSTVNPVLFPQTRSLSIRRKWGHDTLFVWFASRVTRFFTCNSGLPRTRKGELTGLPKSVAYFQLSNFSTFLCKVRNLSRKSPLWLYLIDLLGIWIRLVQAEIMQNICHWPNPEWMWEETSQEHQYWDMWFTEGHQCNFYPSYYS